MIQADPFGHFEDGERAGRTVTGVKLARGFSEVQVVILSSSVGSSEA